MTRNEAVVEQAKRIAAKCRLDQREGVDRKHTFVIEYDFNPSDPKNGYSVVRKEA
jgi:hypothetical protein